MEEARGVGSEVKARGTLSELRWGRQGPEVMVAGEEGSLVGLCERRGSTTPALESDPRGFLGGGKREGKGAPARRHGGCKGPGSKNRLGLSEAGKKVSSRGGNEGRGMR